MIQLKRVYEPVTKKDGFRILVDRLWPRGLTKGKAKIDLWLKEIGPSDGLRKWFGHDVSKWNEFQNRYKQELENKQGLLNTIKEKGEQYKLVTLVYGAKDKTHNQAIVLKEVLEQLIT